MNDSFRIFLGIAGTTTTAALETSTEHPATIFAAAATGVFMAVSTLYKIKNGGK